MPLVVKQLVLASPHTPVTRATLQDLILECSPPACLRAVVSGLGAAAAGVYDVAGARSAARITTLFDLLDWLGGDGAEAEWRAYIKAVTRAVGFEAPFEDDLRDRPLVERALWVLLFWAEQWAAQEWEAGSWAPTDRQLCLLLQHFKHRLRIDLGGLDRLLQAHAAQHDKDCARLVRWLRDWLKHVDDGHELPGSDAPKTPPAASPASTPPAPRSASTRPTASPSSGAASSSSAKLSFNCRLCKGRKPQAASSCGAPCFGGRAPSPKPESPEPEKATSYRKRPRSPLEPSGESESESASESESESPLPPLPPLGGIGPLLPFTQSAERNDVLLRRPDSAINDNDTSVPRADAATQTGPSMFDHWVL